MKSGFTTFRYLGTGRTTGVSGQCEDSDLKRFLWNYYNRVESSLVFTESAANSWSYTTPTWRQANANSAAKVEVVIGLVEDTIDLTVLSSVFSASAAPYALIGIGEDTTSAPHADCHREGGGYIASVWLNFASYLTTYPSSIGYHYYAWLEYASASTITFFAGIDAVPYRAGLSGTHFC